MTKKIIIVLFISLIGFRSISCDVCGCSMSGLYFGFIPIKDSHFVGVKYSRATFNAFIDNDGYYFEDEFSEDTYQRFELVGRFSVSKRIQFRFLVPLLYNQMVGSHQNVNSFGFSDPVLLTYYSLLNPDPIGGIGLLHSLNIGGGVKLPMGEYNKADQEEIINRNFQLGSGSLDYLVSSNYTLRYQKVGLSAEASYKVNMANKQGYRFGNQMNVSTNIFYYIEAYGYSIIPLIGLYYENSSYHTNDEIVEANTGGYSWLGTIGMQFFVGSITMNFQYQLPIEQHFNTDSFASIKGGDRLNLGIFYSISGGKD